MSSFTEKIVLKGIPSVQMKIIGKTSKVDVEVLRRKLGNDEDLLFGVIYSNEENLLTGYFLENETNRWWIIRNGACSGSFLDCYETLEEAIYFEDVWFEIQKAIEKDSEHRDPEDTLTKIFRSVYELY